MSTDLVRHAGRMGDDRSSLCGKPGRSTRPMEVVNCPTCRVIINHLRDAYPPHADYTDWRPTRAQLAEAAEAMYRDLVLGETGD